MKITFNEEIIDVKYTFNSFKYMEDLDFGDLQSLENTPFKIASIMSTLLLGGLNYNPRKEVSPNKVYDILEDVMENGEIFKLLEDLMKELEKSSFFKNLQKKEK